MARARACIVPRTLLGFTDTQDQLNLPTTVFRSGLNADTSCVKHWPGEK